LIYSRNFAKKWVLLGYKTSNDDNPTQLYQSIDDPNMDTGPKTTVLTIANEQHFQRYRILAKDHPFGGVDKNFHIYAVEFFGTLLETPTL
jgi:hypothetical protein